MSFRDDIDFHAPAPAAFPWAKRYPRGVVGEREWSRFDWDNISIPTQRDGLSRLPSFPPPVRRTRPRLFVSHRSGKPDEDFALRIGSLAAAEGFTYWIDVLDPRLVLLNSGQVRLPRILQAFFVAAAVEIALLNCTHVLAVMTRRTAVSRWVPYEYGRVKDSRLLATTATTWLHPRAFTGKTMPEYLWLGPRFRTNAARSSEHALRTWLATERGLFVPAQPTPPSRLIGGTPLP